MAKVNKTKKYEIVKKFIGGLLEGLTYTEVTTVAFNVGEKFLKPYGNTSPFEIVSVKEVKHID